MTTDLNKAMLAVEVEKPMPVKTINQLMASYRERIQKQGGRRLDLSKWIEEFKGKVRPLIPGDFAVFLADTGQGKTAILQSIAYKACPPLPTLFFQIELSDDLVCERILALHTRQSAELVEHKMKHDQIAEPDSSFDHLKFCTLSNVSLDDIKKIVLQQNEILPEPIAVVFVDYIGLIKGDGKSRYERFSNVAEGLKTLAKELDVVIIGASQVHRAEGNDEIVKPSLHSAKDSGSIENSVGLLVGIHREGEDGSQMKLRVLKNTRGIAGVTIDAEFDGATSTVRDQLYIPRQKMVEF